MIVVEDVQSHSSDDIRIVQDVICNDEGPQKSNDEEHDSVFYVDDKIQPRSLLPTVHFDDRKTNLVGFVDPGSSKVIYHSCCTAPHIPSQCTLRVYQLDKVVKK